MTEPSEPPMPDWAAKFLAAFAAAGNVSTAAKAAGVGRQWVYKVRAENPAFATEMDAAREAAGDKLEQEAFRRAVTGVLKPVYQGGKKVGTVREYSDQLLALLLRATRPAKFRENVRTEIAGDPATPVRVEATHDHRFSLSPDAVEFARAVVGAAGDGVPGDDRPPAGGGLDPARAAREAAVAPAAG